MDMRSIHSGSFAVPRLDSTRLGVSRPFDSLAGQIDFGCPFPERTLAITRTGRGRSAFPGWMDGTGVSDWAAGWDGTTFPLIGRGGIAYTGSGSPGRRRTTPHEKQFIISSDVWDLDSLPTRLPSTTRAWHPIRDDMRGRWDHIPPSGLFSLFHFG